MSGLRLRDAIRRLRSAVSEGAGQDLLEYALLASLIAVVVFGAINTVGTTIKTVFWDVIGAAKF